jgi:hypothetical protein
VSPEHVGGEFTCSGVVDKLQVVLVVAEFDECTAVGRGVHMTVMRVLGVGVVPGLLRAGGEAEGAAKGRKGEEGAGVEHGEEKIGG